MNAQEEELGPYRETMRRLLGILVLTACAGAVGILTSAAGFSVVELLVVLFLLAASWRVVQLLISGGGLSGDGGWIALMDSYRSPSPFLRVARRPISGLVWIVLFAEIATLFPALFGSKPTWFVSAILAVILALLILGHYLTRSIWATDYWHHSELSRRIEWASDDSSVDGHPSAASASTASASEWEPGERLSAGTSTRPSTGSRASEVSWRPSVSRELLGFVQFVDDVRPAREVWMVKMCLIGVPPAELARRCRISTDELDQIMVNILLLASRHLESAQFSPERDWKTQFFAVARATPLRRNPKQSDRFVDRNPPG